MLSKFPPVLPLRSVILVATALAIPSLSFAEEKQMENAYPNISGSLSIEVQNDQVYDADDSSAELNDLYPTVTLETKFAITPELSINLGAVLEPVEDANDDRAFEDLGGYVEVLSVHYDTDLFSLHAGKSGANFGIAWDAMPGLYGTDLNEDYEISEVFGLGGGVNFNAAGSHTVSGSVFFADTTFLSDSAGTSRGPLEKSDGGPGNTESLSSFAFAVDGEFDRLEGFRYHLGFASLADGDDGTDDQLGYVLGGEYAFAITEQVTLTPIAEYAYLDNYGGTDGDNAQFVSAGLGAAYENWFGSVTHQYRGEEIASDTVDTDLTSLTVGYAFDMGLEIAGAWSYADEDGETSKTLGVLVAYAIDF